jgi:hypothetical protein
MMTRQIYIIIAIAALTLASPASTPRAMKLDPTGLEITPLPSTAQVITASTQADLDGDGLSERIIVTSAGQAAILSGTNLRWQSPKGWQVRQALIADLNQDGFSEVVLLVWRPFKPWPVDKWLPNGGRINRFHNQAGLSCHLILIGWYQNTFRERWAGSALAEPIQRFAATDLSASGKQFLVTLDGSYDTPIGAPATQLKVWEWNGFGFTVISKVDGRFTQLAIIRDDNRQALILAP